MPPRITTRSDLQALFRGLGLTAGRDVLMHSALFSLGRIEGGLEGFYAALRDVVGPGATVVVPTFTYSFRRGQTFDVLNSPAPPELGVFSEYLRKRPGVVRSPCPLFSLAAEGPRANELMQRRSKRCFGVESVYDTLFEANLRTVALGITYSTGVSGFMHLEKMAGVDYRVDLKLTGTSIDASGRAYADEALHFARDETRFPNGRTDREGVGRELEAAGIATAIEYGSGRHVGFDMTPFAAFVLNKLRTNPRTMFLPNG